MSSSAHGNHSLSSSLPDATLPPLPRTHRPYAKVMAKALTTPHVVLADAKYRVGGEEAPAFIARNAA